MFVEWAYISTEYDKNYSNFLFLIISNFLDFKEFKKIYISKYLLNTWLNSLYILDTFNPKTKNSKTENKKIK